MKRIIAIIDTIDSTVPPQSFEILTYALNYSARIGGDPLVLIAGERIKDAAHRIAGFGVDVIALEHPAFRIPNPDLLIRAARGIMAPHAQLNICIPHTMRGGQIAAALSVIYGLPCFTSVESFEVEGDTLMFRRALFNGKIEAIIEAPGKGCVVTVAPGACQPPANDTRTSAGSVTVHDTSNIESQVRPVTTTAAAVDAVRLEEADVIVSVGRGIGARDNLELANEVARLFPNAGIGASRPICDSKWLPYAHQVGVTGKTVAPKLYLALGISGSSQHTAGMKGAQLIVAVNRDPQAAIFSVADIIIIEDLATFLQALIEKHREMILGHEP